jgi:hypothetical protein
VFEKKSRYAKLTTYKVKDGRGRTVTVVPVPASLEQTHLGYHALRQGQRLDHLAKVYLDDVAAFWRLCELNDVMLAESLTEAREVAIPDKVV